MKGPHTMQLESIDTLMYIKENDPQLIFQGAKHANFRPNLGATSRKGMVPQTTLYTGLQIDGNARGITACGREGSATRGVKTLGRDNLNPKEQKSEKSAHDRTGKSCPTAPLPSAGFLQSIVPRNAWPWVAFAFHNQDNTDSDGTGKVMTRSSSQGSTVL